MLPLPIDTHLPHILTALRTHNALILTAQPGAGKTTRVPPALLNLLPQNQALIMLQPRRVAARAAAERIAHENQWQLGQQVGYHIRFEKRYTSQTRIRILTEAILTRILLDDPYLEGPNKNAMQIGCVILDEFHERNLHTDLALAFLRELQQTVRPDLKLLIMSATLDAQSISAYLNDAPIINVEGRTFPIDISYHPPKDTRLEDHITNLVTNLLQAPTPDFSLQPSSFRLPNDILIFLPGQAEIERTRRAIENQKSKIENPTILPLHGSLPPEDQQRALNPDPQHRQKIILATNIAETSLTIDGVRTVIDSGLARVASFDPDRGMDRLDLQRISKASATQRAGRAGRQAPGRALRLWSQSEQNHLQDFNLPEIQRIDLAPALLALHGWGAKDPQSFPWFEKPNEESLAAAENLLTLLGALSEPRPSGSDLTHATPVGSSLTDLGQQMLRFPAHPRIARLLLAAQNTPFQPEALTLATQLSDDARTGTTNSPPSPHLARAREQFANILRTLPPTIENRKSGGGKIENPTDLLLLAYPDRIARRRGSDPHSALMVGNIGLRLAKEALTPALVAAPLFLALDVQHDTRNRRAEALVRHAVPLDELSLQRLFPHELHEQTALQYDPEKEKVIALTRRSFRDLTLHEDPHGKVDLALAAQTLAAALAPRAIELFTQNPAANKLLARTALLRHYMPEHPWPPFDEPQLQFLLKEAATTGGGGGKRTLKDLTESPALADAIRNALPYPLDRLLDQHAPETIEVPTGNKIKLEYSLPPIENQKSSAEKIENPQSKIENPPTPILVVRLQELFGLMQTPRIANGRGGGIPVLLHLLSPGYKPIQITSDLHSFWSNAYFEVRKDLRTKYPKHKWPENPLTATPEAKGRKK